MRTLVTAALTSHIIAEPAPIAPKIWRELRDVVAKQEDVLEWATKWLTQDDAKSVSTRLELIDNIREELANLSQMGITAITEFDDEFPQKWFETLGEKRPPLLFVAGEVALLNRPSIAVVGSRDVDDAGRAFAVELGRAIALNDYCLCSGGARGVDQISANAAYMEGGSSIAFLADSLAKVAKASETREALQTGCVCIATPFSPHAGFQVGNAMARNKLIYGFSEAAVVVSSAEGTGGTWSGATEALSTNLTRVFVRIENDVPVGNKKLEKLGAVPLEDAAELFTALATASPSQSLF